MEGMSADALLDYARKVHDRHVVRDIPQAIRAHGFAWGWAYTAEACLVAYRRTGDERFLDWFVGSYDAILEYRDSARGLRDDYRGRTTSSWGGGRYLPGQWITTAVIGGRIVYPSLEFVSIVRGAPAPLARFAPAAARYLEIASAVVHEYDEDFTFFPESGKHYYGMPLKNQADAINHVHSLVNCHILLWRLAEDRSSREKAVACCEVFRQSIKVAPSGAYYWPFRPYWAQLPNNQWGERIWKAQVSSATAILAYKAGVAFDANDMQGFVRTFLDLVHAGGNEFRDRIDLEPGPHYRDKDFKRLYNVVGFLPWSEFEPRIAEIIFHIVDTRPDVFPKGFFTGPSSARGYAWRLPPR
jgi:hypothetical protein